MPTLGHCNVEPSLLLELVGMETRSGAHGQRPPQSETKEGKILSQDLPLRASNGNWVKFLQRCCSVSKNYLWKNVRSMSVGWCADVISDLGMVGRSEKVKMRDKYLSLQDLQHLSPLNL